MSQKLAQRVWDRIKWTLCSRVKLVSKNIKLRSSPTSPTTIGKFIFFWDGSDFRCQRYQSAWSWLELVVTLTAHICIQRILIEKLEERTFWISEKFSNFSWSRNWRRKQFYLKTCIMIHNLWRIRIRSWTLKERSAPETGYQTDDQLTDYQFENPYYQVKWGTSSRSVSFLSCHMRNLEEMTIEMTYPSL